MAYMRIINEEEASGRLAEDYRYLSDSYSHIMGGRVPTPIGVNLRIDPRAVVR